MPDQDASITALCNDGDLLPIRAPRLPACHPDTQAGIALQTSTQYACQKFANVRMPDLATARYGGRVCLTGDGMLLAHRHYETEQQADRAISEVLRVARGRQSARSTD